MPSHTAVPWIHAMGNKIAPAIKNPQDAVLRQTMMWVNHEAITQPIKMSGSSSSILTPLLINTLCTESRSY